MRETQECEVKSVEEGRSKVKHRRQKDTLSILQTKRARQTDDRQAKSEEEVASANVKVSGDGSDGFTQGWVKGLKESSHVPARRR